MTNDKILKILYNKYKYLRLPYYCGMLVFVQEIYGLSEKDIYRAMKYYPKPRKKCKK